MNEANVNDMEREIARKQAFAAEVAAGGVRHNVWASRDYGVPAVGMANEEDPYYVMWFASREQINAFIQRLQAAADEAFGG